MGDYDAVWRKTRDSDVCGANLVLAKVMGVKIRPSNSVSERWNVPMFGQELIGYSPSIIKAAPDYEMGGYFIKPNYLAFHGCKYRVEWGDGEGMFKKEGK